MNALRRFLVNRVLVALGFAGMLYIHPSIPDTGIFQGLKQVATFSLGPGQWIIVAKASAKGHGGNDGLTDCRLRVDGTEGSAKSSDESYGSPPPLLGTSMTVLLPFKVETRAQFQLQAGVQAKPAEFVHLVLWAIRDISAT